MTYIAIESGTRPAGRANGFVLKTAATAIFALLAAQCSPEPAYEEPAAPAEELAYAEPAAAPAEPLAYEEPEQARCSYVVGNGHVLQNNMGIPEFGHRIEIQNGTAGDAIIKVRDASTNQLRVSFFVARNQTAQFDDLPDGSYILQYAFGDALAADCKSFITIHSADRFPGVEYFESTEVGDEIETQILGYTLYATPDGDVEPQSISESEFERD